MLLAIGLVRDTTKTVSYVCGKCGKVCYYFFVGRSIEESYKIIGELLDSGGFYGRECCLCKGYIMMYCRYCGRRKDKGGSV